MPRTGISFDEVKAACEQIVSTGEGNVTLAAVRSILGTGSNSTINKHVRTWREGHRERIRANQSDLGISEDFAKSMQAEIAFHITKAKEELETQLVEMRDEADDATAGLEKAEHTIEKLKYSMAEMQSQHAKSQTDLEKRLSVAESKLAQQAEKNEQLEKDKSLLLDQGEKARTELAKTQLKTESFELDAEESKKTIKNLEKQNTANQTKISGLEKDLAIAQVKNESFSTAAKESSESIKDFEEQIATAQTKISELEKGLAITQAKNEDAVVVKNELQEQVKESGANLHIASENEKVLQGKLYKAEKTTAVAEEHAKGLDAIVKEIPALRERILELEKMLTFTDSNS